VQVLEVKDLAVSFKRYERGFRQKETDVISGLNLTLNAGEILAVVGASGSGKSLLAHAVLGILPDNAAMSGEIWFEGEPLTPMKQAALRGKAIAFIPQSVTYLDPLMRVGEQVRTSVRTGDPAVEQRRVFERYCLRPEAAKLYPFQLSGGMMRRVMVSMAAVSGARLIIADEPTPGLDPASLAQALGHLRELADAGAAVMLITHDLESSVTVADRIAVFHAGRTVEVAPASAFAGHGDALRHPYSQALWRALPQNEFQQIAGSRLASVSASGGSMNADNIGFRYGRKQPWLFRGMTLSLSPGEIVGLSGTSGSGKTTFARILAGYERPFEGNVTIHGAPPPAKGFHPVQLIFQHPEKSVNPRWRMREMLREGGEADERMMELLGIREEWLDRWPHELSGGELQRFCVARALGPGTRFLIADEITTMLDAITQAQIWHALLQIAEERNLGLLVISHDESLLKRLCTRRIELTR